MWDITSQQMPQTGFKISDLSQDERDRLVGAFTWLIEEDKKQNPAFYQVKNQTNYD